MASLRWLLLFLFASFSLVSPAFSHIKQWNTRSLPLILPCSQKLPDMQFELTREYRMDNAFLLLWAAALAESPDRNAILSGLKAWGFGDTYLIGKPQKGAYAYIAEDENFHLLSFRGTNSWQESLVDSLFLPGPFSSIQMPGSGHQGMMLHFKQLLKETEGILKTIDPNQSKPLLITGHSLGGAMAQLHAMHFARTGWDLIGLYTSAQPQVGDAAFNDEVSLWLQNRYFRLEADQDLTPRLPPSAKAAEVFSQIIPDQLKGVQTLLRNFVSSMNYDTPRGVRLAIGKELVLDADDGPMSEIRYWSELRGTITDGRTFPEVIASLQRRTKIHPPQEYMCAYIQASIPSLNIPQSGIQPIFLQ